jgi:hypothetical protein
MRSSKWDSPHPLLADGRDDYTVGDFKIIEGEHSLVGNDFVLNFGYELTCPGLEDYIRNGKADVIISVSSRASKFRREFTFNSSETKMKLRIPKDDLVRNVELIAYIVSLGDDKFTLPEHNVEYYGNALFKLRKGDILAESLTVVISLDDSELQKPLSSIFQISESPEGYTEAITPYFDDDRIQIFLLPDEYRKYATLRRDHADLRRNLSAIITLPVLIEAIEFIRSEEMDDEHFQKYRWYRALTNQLANQGIDIEDTNLSVSTIANKIYGNIIKDALSTIQNKLNDLADNSEMQELGGID